MSLKLVADPVAQTRADALSSHIDRLSVLVGEAMNGTEVENVDALTKLVTALARLTEARSKAEQVVKPADLTLFVAGMTASINAHVAAPEERESLQRAWRRLIEQVAG